MQNLNPEYVVGLVDGEGSFTIYIRDPKLPRSVKRRVTVEPKFYIKLIERRLEHYHRPAPPPVKDDTVLPLFTEANA